MDEESQPLSLQSIPSNKPIESQAQNTQLSASRLSSMAIEQPLLASSQAEAPKPANPMGIANSLEAPPPEPTTTLKELSRNLKSKLEEIRQIKLNLSK
jgi:hypothetical protein